MDWIALSSAVASVVVFANTWQGQFVYDDSRAIVGNEDLRGSTSWWDLWGHDFWGTPLNHPGSHKSWRPLCVASFRLNYHLSGLNPSSYHAVNVALHALVTLCFSLLVKSLTQKPWVRWTTSLAFAVHPIHCEAVASIVGRAELGMALHILLALLAYGCYVNQREGSCWPLSSTRTSSAANDKRKVIHRWPADVLGLLPGSLGCWWLSGAGRVGSHVGNADQIVQPAGGCQRHSGPGGWREASDCAAIEQYHRHEGSWPATKWRTRLYLAASLSTAASAVLWKETGITAVPLCAIVELTSTFVRQRPARFSAIFTQAKYRETRRSLSLLAAVAAVQLVIRLYMLGGSTPSFAAADNPISHDNSALTRTLTFLHLPVFNVWLLLWPARLSFDWSMDAVSPVRQIRDVRNAVSLIFYASLAVLTVKMVQRTRQAARTVISSRWRLAAAGLSLMILPFLPASNMFFYVGFVVAERVLYLPSMGFCLLLGCGLDHLSTVLTIGESGHAAGRTRRRPHRRSLLYRSLQVMTAVTLLLWSLRTIQRNADWCTEEQLYRSGIAINPAKAYGNLAAILARQHREAEAEYAYRKALLHRPNMAETHFNLAVLLQKQGREQEAASSYLQSIHYRPNLALAYLNLGLLLLKQGRQDEAAHWLRICSQLSDKGMIRDVNTHRQTRISALLHWAKLEASRSEHRRALGLYQRLLEFPLSNNQRQMVYNALGESHHAVGDIGQGERWYRLALEIQPDDVATHLTYARLLAKNTSRHDEAEQLFRQARELAPSDPSVYMLTGQFLLDLSRHREAAEQFVTAAQLAPDDFEAAFNAATTLREIQQMELAEHFYRLTVRLRPNDVTVYRNLGAMLHVNGKYQEAEYNYRQALRLAPDDRVTLINLKRLHQLMTSNSNSSNNNSSSAASKRSSVQLNQQSAGPHHPNES